MTCCASSQIKMSLGCKRHMSPWPSAFQIMELGSKDSHLEGGHRPYITVMLKADLQVSTATSSNPALDHPTWTHFQELNGYHKCWFHVYPVAQWFLKIINLVEPLFFSLLLWFLLACVKFCVLPYSSLWKPHLSLCLTANGFIIFASWPTLKKTKKSTFWS